MDKIVIKNDDSQVNNLDSTVAKDEGQNVPELNAEQIQALEDEQEAERLKNTNTDGEGDDTKDIVNIDDKDYVVDTETGALLNQDGTVFKTKDEYEQLKKDAEVVVDDKDKDKDKNKDTTEGQEVEIDGKDYKFDKLGNAVDTEGKIAFTVDQIKEMQKATEEVSAVDIKSIMNSTGIVISNEDNSDAEYENNEQGIARYATDVYKKGGKDTLDELYTKLPVVQDLIYHLESGGNIDNFNVQTNYSAIKLDKENATQLKDIIYKAQLSRGTRPEAIDKYYEAIVAGDTDNDEAFKEAEIELKYLTTQETANKTNRDATIKQRKDAELVDYNNLWGASIKDGKLSNLNVKGSIYDIISNGKLKLGDEEFVIPEKVKTVNDGKTEYLSREDVFKYVFEPIVVNIDGKPVVTTRDQLKVSNENNNKTIHDQIYAALRRLTNYDDAQFIKEQVNNSNVKNVLKLKTKKITQDGQVNSDPNKKQKIIIKTT